MKLRPYQKICINLCLEALEQHKQTLCIAPTGAGKTIILATVTNKLLERLGGKKRAIVLVHRNKINFQNQKSFERICGRKTSVFIAQCKSLAGQVVFGMMQTIIGCYEKLPPFDIIIVDEVHHTRAKSYENFIDDQRAKNPDLIVFGVTATPNRGDEKGLKKVINNFACQIKLGELIDLNYLVKPIAKVFNIFELENRNFVSKEKFFSKSAKLLVKELEENNRKKIIIFVLNAFHANCLEKYLIENNIIATTIISEYGQQRCDTNLRKFEKGDARVLINIDIATEGYDYPPIDCVVLMRALGNKSMLMQMVGRGLRTIDHTKYPDNFKQDCLILDFGKNISTFGDLEQEVDLVGKDKFPATMQLRQRRFNGIDKEEEEYKGITTNIFEGSLEKDSHFESFNYNDKYIQGICGFDKSFFCIDREHFFYKEGKELSYYKIQNQKEMDDIFIKHPKLTENKEFFDKIKGQAITNYQCSCLIEIFDLVGCSRYRASVLLNFIVNWKLFETKML